MRKLAILFPLILLLSHCKEPEFWDEVCFPIKEQQKKFPPFSDPIAQTISFPFGSIGIACLDVNPHNGNEFLLRGIPSENATNFYRYNAETRERIYLPRDILMTSRPRWSRKDWLIFAGQSGPQQWDAYKMKSDGDSLTRLTWSGNIHTPEWNWEGDKFICQTGLTSPAYSIIFDENGAPLDTLYAGGGVGSWRHPEGYRAGFVFTGSFRVTHPESGSVVFKLPVDDVSKSFDGGSEWIDEENIVWSYEHGVFRTNIRTMEKVQLIASCDAITYEWPVYSFLTGKLIFKRVSKKLTAYDKGVVRGEFVTVDPFDGAQELIEIDGY